MKKSQALIFSIIISMYCQAQLSNGLIAYWPLNGNAKDVSGNNVQVQVSTTPTEDRDLNKGCAVTLQPYDFQVKPNQGSLFDLAPNDSFSLAYWYKGFYTSGGSFGYFVSEPSGYLNVGLSNTDVYVSANNFYQHFQLQSDPSRWYFLAITYHKDSLKIYRNDSLKFALKVSVVVTKPVVYLWRTGNIGNIEMDDIRYYDRRLSNDEIHELYNMAGSCDITTEIEKGYAETSHAKFISKVVNMSGQEIKDFENFRGLALVLYTDGTHKKVLK